MLTLSKGLSLLPLLVLMALGAQSQELVDGIPYELRPIRSERQVVQKALTCPTGYSSCAGTSSCCPTGDVCVSGGCCDAGSASCASGCYEPATEICCSSRGACPKTHFCCSDWGCCPTGSTCVSGGKCSNSGTNAAFSRKGVDTRQLTCAGLAMGLLAAL